MKQSYASIKFVDPQRSTSGSLKWVNGSKITRGDLEKHFSNENQVNSKLIFLRETPKLGELPAA